MVRCEPVKASVVGLKYSISPFAEEAEVLVQRHPPYTQEARGNATFLRLASPFAVLIQAEAIMTLAGAYSDIQLEVIESRTVTDILIVGPIEAGDVGVEWAEEVSVYCRIA